MQDASVGQELRDGRYAIVDVLGEGAQGATLLAVDKRRGVQVAIKRFHVRGAKSWKDVELAEREARVLSSLEHPLLPRAIEHFEEAGALYLVMDHIEGDTLARAGRLGRADVSAFLQDADEVLSYLHDRAPPVIHRDIKPSNVIRRMENGVTTHVLVDFGSVSDKLRPRGGSTVAGTFGFMAPEQFQGRALPQSDVYAVGATAICLLTGEQPEDLPHKGLAIDVITALGGRSPMAEVLQKLLEPDPDRRPSRIGPLLSALEQDEDPENRPDDEPGPHARRSRSRRPRRRSPSSDYRAPWIVHTIVHIGIAIARVAVMLTMRAFVPALLTILSVVFGSALRRAASAVHRAGGRADAAMQRALDRYVQGSEAEPTAAEAEPTAAEAEPPAKGARFAEQRAPGPINYQDASFLRSKQYRIEDEPREPRGPLQELIREIDAELEAASERSEERRRRRRKHQRD